MEPTTDYGTICTAFEQISGIPSPLKPGDDPERHFIEHGDPFAVYKEQGRYGELLGFATAMEGKELPKRPSRLPVAIAKVIAPISEAAQKVLRWEEGRKGFELLT